jgi:hypothetical protein
MRLLRRLEGLEAGAAVAEAEAEAAVGVVWSCDELRLDATQLEAGEYIACDSHRLDPPELFASCPRVRLVERITRDADDLGYIYDAAGVRVGRVTAVDGNLVSYRAVRPGGAVVV